MVIGTGSAEGEDGDGRDVADDDAAVGGAGGAEVGGSIKEGHGPAVVYRCGGAFGGGNGNIHLDGRGHGDVAGLDVAEEGPEGGVAPPDEAEECAVGVVGAGDLGAADGGVALQVDRAWGRGGWVAIGEGGVDEVAAAAVASEGCAGILVGGGFGGGEGGGVAADAHGLAGGEGHGLGLGVEAGGEYGWGG